jgi:hypothetical protein
MFLREASIFFNEKQSLGESMASNIAAAKESATKLNNVNGFVFLLNIAGSVILIIFGFIPVEDPLCGGYFCEEGLYNFQFTMIGAALFLAALLTYRVLEAFSEQIHLNVEILEEIKKH